MAITDEKRQELSELVFSAFDNIERNFPDEADATISSAILITEIMFTSPDGESVTQIAWFPTDVRSSLNFGLLESARLGIVKNTVI